jgi:hypothetical protein
VRRSHDAVLVRPDNFHFATFEVGRPQIIPRPRGRRSTLIRMSKAGCSLKVVGSVVSCRFFSAAASERSRPSLVLAAEHQSPEPRGARRRSWEPPADRLFHGCRRRSPGGNTSCSAKGFAEDLNPHLAIAGDEGVVRFCGPPRCCTSRAWERPQGGSARTMASARSARSEG